MTGSNGQLGQDLTRVLSRGHDVFGFGRNELDVSDLQQTCQVVQKVVPDVILHSAAYTAVDLAETEEDNAFLVNAFGSRNVAIAARNVDAKVCYISTDYVFDGQNARPYNEFDIPNPQSVYGRSKRAGETFTQMLSVKCFIVRTSWVFGLHGNNFVKTMLKLARERNNLSVVNDQIGSPTYTLDLAQFLNELIQTEKYGIYHATNAGECTWYELARTLFQEFEVAIDLVPCATEEFPRPAPRPKYSVLDNMSIRLNGFTPLRAWRDALVAFLQELQAQPLAKGGV